MKTFPNQSSRSGAPSFSNERALLACKSIGSVAAALTVVLAASDASAVNRGTIPVLMQITSNTVGTISKPQLRSQNGDSIVFTSDGDVTGAAPGHNEIYFYDATAKTTIRVTTTVGGESREGVRLTDGGLGTADRPVQVTFISTGDLDPTVGNPDHNPEIFVWVQADLTFHQLTKTTGGVINQQPYDSDSGKCIVFSSTADLDNNPGDVLQIPPTHFTNPDHSQEVFLYSVRSGANYPDDGFFTQISNGPLGTSSSEPVVGGFNFVRQCDRVAYTSDHDQIGGGLTGSNIYVYDPNLAETTTMQDLHLGWSLQPGDYLHPAISGASPFARGPFITFQTDADEWRNGSDGYEIYRYRVFHDQMVQYTSYLNGDVERPQISDGGGYLSFQSTAEVLDIRRDAIIGGTPPFNADGNSEIFRVKNRARAWQITNTTGCTNDLPSARDDETAIAFRSDCDLIPGGNPDHVQQIYLYRLVTFGEASGTAAGCLVADGCCNEANGCYHPIYGRKGGTPSKGCIDHPSGCPPLLQ